ncbi:uncharacterized protein LOC123507406 isoform X2 [Portunus trituberculatus]|uniref:uncharacterized protein LOC123507406 isoform X2 n=1 Tax=Portunus trituberculatus TaxID=210409 RepID=UPI001E1CF40C|nr:uncharacterized protein LOC123507406 isoform X2 [Portunus trituberculatus]
MSSPGEEEGDPRSPRSRSPAMGVSGLLRDHAKAGGGVEEEGRRGSGGGILKLDPAKPRRSSAASVEFRTDKDDPSSPCPSDRLSVTWADGERSVSSDGVSLVQRGPGSTPDQPSINTLVPACGSLLEEAQESALPEKQHQHHQHQQQQEDEEYGASVSAILRRSSCRGGSRRSTRRRKKPRRTSTVTTSSGETVVEVDGLSEEEEVAETLRIHKEVVAGVRLQPWPIARKLRLARASREYIRRHEGELEERLAQSTSTWDVLLHCFIRARRVLRGGVRAVYVWVSGLEPWQGRIKTIESHFGSAVASYFTFLRWVLGLNVALVALLAAFVIIPEFLASDRDSAGERKSILPWERISAYDFKVLWDFEGVMRYSPIFYGYYSKDPYTSEGYRLPLAYFLTSLAVYAYSFVAILRKMAANSRMSKLAEDEECTFTWRLLASWDYTIGNPEAAQNKVAAINTGFRESLLEAKESEKEEKSWKLRLRRLLAHFIVVLIIVASAYAVVLLVKRSVGVDSSASWWQQNELTLTLTLISFVCPNLFDLVGMLEARHPRNQLQWQLARIMSFNLLNLYTLIFALFSKVDDMTKDLEELKENLTAVHMEELQMLTTITPWTPNTTIADPTDASITYNASVYAPTPSLGDRVNLGVVEDGMTSFSSTLPAVILDTEASLSSTLAASFLTAASLSKLLLPKGDPRQKTPPPGCHVLPVTCPSTVPASTTSATAFSTTPPTSTHKHTDWAEVIYGLGGDGTLLGDEPVYLGEDNLTTPSWLSTESTQEPGGDYENYPAETDSSAISSDPRVDGSTPNTSTSSPVPIEADGVFSNYTSEASTNITSPYPHVASNTAMANTLSSTPVITVGASNGSNNGSLHLSEPELSGDGGFSNGTELDKPFRALGNESSTMSLEVLEGHTTPPPPSVATTPHTLDKSEHFAEVSGTTKAIIEGPPEYARLETSTEATGAKEENFLKLMKLTPGLPGIFHMLGDLEEEEEAENSMRTVTVHDVIRQKRKVDAVQNSPLPQIQTQDKEAKIKGRSSFRNSPILDEQKQLDVTTEREEVMEVKEREGKSTGILHSPDNQNGENHVITEKKEIMKTDALKDKTLEVKETKGKILEVKYFEENMTSNSYAINHKEREGQKVKNLDKENLSVKRAKRVINDYGGIDVNDAHYLPSFGDDPEDNMMTYDPPPDNSLPMDLDTGDNANNPTETSSTLDSIEETKDNWGTRMVLPTVVSYNISTTDRDSFWAQFLRGTAEGDEATLEPSMVGEESGTTVESLTDLPVDAEDCFVMVCEEPPTTTTTTTTETPTASPTTLPPPTQPTTLTMHPTPTTPEPTTPHPFLVQPMKNNPEKWVSSLPNKSQERLRKLCWETMFGQEIIKLTVMDLVLTVVSVVMTEYVRAVVVRLLNGCFCWDLEKQFPGYADFKIAENILHLVYNQGMVWMGMFFAPGLPVLNTFKLVVMLYVRSWAVVTSNVPPETVFKASNNNNFYLLLLLTMLFLCTLPVGYAVVWLAPSWHCGPFSDYPRIYQLATSTLIGGLPPTLYPIIDYISSPGVVIPAGLLLVLIIYYLVSLTAALREANSDLRDQLRQERSAEKRKALESRSGMKRRSETPTSRWSRVVPLTPLPRPRLDATSDPEKLPAKKPPSALSPEGEDGPIMALCDPPRGKDDGPWPDDMTDLGHSEVFDDSLSESRQVKAREAAEGHEKRARDYFEKERDTEQQHKSKTRKNSFPTQTKEEEDSSFRVPKGRQKSYGSQNRGHRITQERKQSDESLHRDSPTKVRSSHRQYTDSPRERRRSSGSHSSKHKDKLPEDIQEAPDGPHQDTGKHTKTHRGLAKKDSSKLPPETETPTKGVLSTRHRREHSILKLEDLKRTTSGQQKGAGTTVPASQQCSSSDDSQGMQTIPVIKISKEDSVERSLQQAKLQRQDKTQDDPDNTEGSQQSSNSRPGAGSPSSGQHNSSSVELKHVTGKDSTKPMTSKKSAPIETNLDEPYFPESDTAALIEKSDVEKLPLQLATEEESVILSSDEESTLLDK